MKAKKTNITVLLAIILFIPYINSFDTKYFYCNQKIYSDFKGLSTSEINSLCSLIAEDDRFTILLTNSFTYPDESSYTIQSESFYQQQCIKNSIDCAYDFTISVFSNVEKVIITSGSKVIQYATLSQNSLIINKMIMYLKEGKYHDALYYSIITLRKPLLYNKSSGRGRSKGTTVSTSNTVRHRTIHFHFYYSRSISITIFTLILLLILYLIWNYIRNRSIRNKGNEELLDNNFPSFNVCFHSYDNNAYQMDILGENRDLNNEPNTATGIYEVNYDNNN